MGPNACSSVNFKAACNLYGVTRSTQSASILKGCILVKSPRYRRRLTKQREFSFLAWCGTTLVLRLAYRLPSIFSALGYVYKWFSSIQWSTRWRYDQIIAMRDGFTVIELLLFVNFVRNDKGHKRIFRKTSYNGPMG